MYFIYNFFIIFIILGQAVVKATFSQFLFIFWKWQYQHKWQVGDFISIFR